MLDPQQKLAALESEQQQIAQNYKEAEQVMRNCEVRLHQIKGGIDTIKDLIKEDTPEEETT
jgi:hypothetical protein